MTPELEIFTRQRHIRSDARRHRIVERLPARRRPLAAVAGERQDRRSRVLTPAA